MHPSGSSLVGYFNTKRCDLATVTCDRCKRLFFDASTLDASSIRDCLITFDRKDLSLGTVVTLQILMYNQVTLVNWGP
jgi:hypothetical protein